MHIPAIVLLVVTTIAGSATAQPIEIGGTLAVACTGSEGSMCGGAPTPLLGANAAWWVTDSIELGGSVARMLPASRDFVSFTFHYHFREGEAIHPLIGLGSGWFTDRQRIVPPFRQRADTGNEWLVDAIVVAGLSARLRDHWILRAGWQSHRFGNEEGSTQLLFVRLGYRLP